MSHVHLPDGIVSVYLWLPALVVALVWLGVAIRQANKAPSMRRIPFIGAMGALMLLGMSVPLGPLPFHVNLAIITGIIAGPWLGYIVGFIVNLILSLIAHGGITTLGINALIMGAEITLGWYLFHLALSRYKLSFRAVVVPALTLLLTVTMSITVIGLSTGLWEYAMPDAHHHEGHDHHETVRTHDHNYDSHIGEAEHHRSGGLASAIGRFHTWGMSGLIALLVFILVGITMEVCVTVMITRYLYKVRPELLQP